MQINLRIPNDFFCPYAREYITDYSHRWEVWQGSAGSGKSYSICQKLIIRACRESGIRMLVCRRYASTLRETVFALFKENLAKFKLAEYCKINLSDFRIEFPNTSQIIFTGLDEETKLLSLQNISTVWVEEAFECSKDIIEQLNLRLRGQEKNQQIILSFNPISKSHWLYDFCEVNKPDNFCYIHSTYLDNPFLSQEYINSLEELKVRNPQKARVFCYGEWGVNSDGLVFKNWIVQPLDALELSKIYEHRVGIDWGFQDPSVIVDSYRCEATKTIFITNEYYQRGKQLSEVFDALVKMGLRRSKIYADSAEPRSIDYFKKQGIAIYPSVKGPDSVKARIMFLQDHKIIINPNCINAIHEFENFSYEYDKKTNSYFDDRFTHEYSHLIDACGYAYSDIYTKSKLKTIEKGVLGL